MSDLACVDNIWKMLDEMALSDPSGYQNIDPIPFYCGDVYTVDTEETVSIAMHPSVFEQYNFPNDNFDTAKQSLDVDQLIALIILYLQREKNILTQEGDRIEERGSLPKFTTEWSNQPRGGDAMMLESLKYKEFSSADFAIYPPTVTKGEICAHPPVFLSHVENNQGNKLIEEIKPQPHWQLNRIQKRPNAYEYIIQLPPGTRMEDCELDISPRKKDIGIYAFRVNIYKRVKGDYNTATNQKHQYTVLYRWISR
ncbi:conserved hypothetical protein [Echinococcus multilocularis]|uniref:Uncharacterized protein n=1 Tax=Echinococcus multilocularis TaxID=6211 RepID=A0A068YK99_ECHMU|nr:conserved hypothetical protein [Echinococcus multilocularis]